jgi:hypothetical protein
MNDASHCFQATATITTDGGPGGGGIKYGKFSLPAAQVVVIEFVSGTCQTNTTTKLFQLGIETHARGVTANHMFLLNFLFNDGTNNYYTISEVTQIYHDDGTSIPFAGLAYSAVGEQVVNCIITISGYFVPLSEPPAGRSSIRRPASVGPGS